MIEFLENFIFETLHLSNPYVGLAVVGFIFILFNQLLRITSFLTKIGILGCGIVAIYFWLG